MRTFVFVVLAASVATPAVAQDATTFTGPRAEATIGWDQLKFDLATIGGSGRQRASDLGYGGALGYDAALSPTLVGGVEIDISGSDAEHRRGTSTTGGVLRARREIALAGRLGTTITPNTLLYGMAGYSNLQVRETRIVSSAASNAIHDLDGVMLGAGVEVKISPKAYVKSEYRYTNYADGYDGNAVKTGIGIRF